MLDNYGKSISLDFSYRSRALNWTSEPESEPVNCSEVIYDLEPESETMFKDISEFDFSKTAKLYMHFWHVQKFKYI